MANAQVQDAGALAAQRAAAAAAGGMGFSNTLGEGGSAQGVTGQTPTAVKALMGQ